jgi:hypothetical protein
MSNEENKSLLSYIDRVTKYIDAEYLIDGCNYTHDIIQIIHTGYDNLQSVPRTAQKAVKAIRKRA